ncbi:MAG: DoxX family protein [Bacteroidota bacterium]
MKKWNWLYWLTTGVLSLFMIFSAYMYVFSAEMISAFEHLMLPDYFRVELAVAKVMGALILVLPFARWVKEWAYAGFFITFVSAIVAHLAVNDPISAAFGPMVALLLLFASYLGFRQRE